MCRYRWKKIRSINFLEEKFNQMVAIVQSLPKDGDITVSDNDKLKFYSFYKQATCVVTVGKKLDQ